MSQLQHHDGDAPGSPTRCSFCANDAAGPCASCERPVCGDCCTLTEGGVRTWAICVACERKKGRSLAGAWGGLVLLLLGVLGALAAAVALLGWLAR